MRILGMVLILTVISCGSGTDTDSVSLPEREWQGIHHRIEEFTERKRNECIDELMEQAVERVNETLLGMDQLIMIDTITGIYKPRRPMKPILRESKDTTPIRPLVNPREQNQ